MLSVEEALERLLSGVGETDVERVELGGAFGRVPADREVTAGHDVPPFSNSAMDGYAVRVADGEAARRVVGESRAGGPPAPTVEAGMAVRIMTGAPMPAGADAVVPVEEADEIGGHLRLHVPPRADAHVRPAGHDVAAGSQVNLPRAPMTPALIGLLAALGLPELRVRRRPRVAILSTGDELVAAGETLARGQIHDANGPALAAAVTEAGGEALLLERAPDDPALIERGVREGAELGDLLIVSGGVSVGEHDHVRSVIERIGALDFWRISVQPGKPLAFGRIAERPVIGLPGNPVSALVTFELFVRPMLRRMLGLAGDGRVRVRALVSEAIAKDPDRRAYLRVRVRRDGDRYLASPAGGQASSQLLPLASANALLVVPEGVAATQPGTAYEAILLGPTE
ncbi:MAG TPA: gephyrin-like molybdotransferase Glp [Methylomirabilota bacterium]|nr:gephyrin-like molybdotransferase Glp [Methylomirabilota bacterium]